MEVISLQKRAPRAKRTQMDTIELTKDQLSEWKAPPFQRPVRVNEKVLSVVADLKMNGVMPGVLTIGVIEAGREHGKYLIDGQHRVKAFEISEVDSILADIRVMTFDTMADMGEAFVEINSSLVSMRPDDILRGMEGAIESLQYIREHCSFVGYDQIRRNENAPLIGMSSLLRAWHGSMTETPNNPSIASIRLGKETSIESARQLVGFLNVALAGWGRDPESYRLWAMLNLTLCMWLYRKLVLDKERGVRRYAVLNQDEFKKCLMSVSADSSYYEWLFGRGLRERDRSPAYQRLKGIFSTRLFADRGKKTQLPQPAWEASLGGRR